MCILRFYIKGCLEQCVFPEFFTHKAAQFCVVRDGLGNNVARAGKSIGRGRYLLFRTYKWCGVLLRCAVHFTLQQDGVGKLLKTACPCNGCARTFFLFVRTVEVFKGLKFLCGFNRLAQCIGHFPLLLNARDDLLLPLDETAQIRQACRDAAQYLIIEGAGGFFAIARNKRNGIAVIEQRNDRCCLLRTNGELVCNRGGDIGNAHGIKPFSTEIFLIIA